MFFDDSDDERDSFDVERRQVEHFRDEFLQRREVESSDDDDEGIIDGSKIPSSSKAKGRARHSFLDISVCSSTSSVDVDLDLDADEIAIIAKSIDVPSPSPPTDKAKKTKQKKSLGVSRAKVYDDETTIRKPTKTDVLETERKMQQLSRSEQLVLPTFVPKPLQTFQDLEKRSRKELFNEIRAKNPSFTPPIDDSPVETPTTESTLADLTKLIEENKLEKKIDRLSRFLNAEILKKKPTIGQIPTTTIDLSETKKIPTLKTKELAPIASPVASKKLFDMQKQLAMRMKEKRAAMLADNPINLVEEKDDEIEEIDDNDDVDDESDSESQQSPSEVLSTVEREPVLPMDEETRDFISDDEEFLPEKGDASNPPSDPNRPSLKTVLNRMESLSEPTAAATNGQSEWFAASEPVPTDNNLELLCSGTFGEDNIIPVSQNFQPAAPMAFSPLPPTQFDNDEEEDLEPRTKNKVRQLSDDDEADEAAEIEDEEEEEEEDGDEEGLDNEELVDYKKQLFEMEAEESEDENIEKRPDENERESDDDDQEVDEELAKFIDTDAVEMDEEEIDDMAKVHLKLKAKEDEHQLKLLKEQYLDFDGDDGERRPHIAREANEDDEEDEDYRSEEEEDDDDDEEDEDEDPTKLKDRFSQLERQRSLQDNQAEELHLDEDLENIGQHSSMFKKGLALKQKKIQSVTTTIVQMETNTTAKKSNSSRPMTLSSVLLAQRFSSTLLAPVNKLNPLHPHSNPNATENNSTAKKQHNPRRHVFATNSSHSHAQENQNPLPSAIAVTAGEKRANSSEKSPSIRTKRFKQSTTTTTTTTSKTTEPSTSVFSALALSTHRH